jgi:predicted transcriptional regulator
MPSQNTEPDFVGLTSEIVAAYVAHNAVSTTDLPKLIHEVYQGLCALASTSDNNVPAPASTPKPAVPIKKSYTAEAITCLECGLKFKTLKRHINTDHNLSSDQYRDKWNLPDNYPMVAPVYSQRRSELAKAVGLGRPLTKKNA